MRTRFPAALSFGSSLDRRMNLAEASRKFACACTSVTSRGSRSGETRYGCPSSLRSSIRMLLLQKLLGVSRSSQRASGRRTHKLVLRDLDLTADLDVFV